jgi:hypothetical protein
MMPIAAFFAGVALLDYLGPTIDSFAELPKDEMHAEVDPPWDLPPEAEAVDERALEEPEVEPSASPTSRREGDKSRASTQNSKSRRATDAPGGGNESNDDTDGVDSPAERDERPVRTDKTAKGESANLSTESDTVPDDLTDGSPDEATPSVEPSSSKPDPADGDRASASDSQPRSKVDLPPGVLVVCEEPAGEGYFPNLRAACAAAKNGDAIELRYDGPRDETPFTLSNIRLTIRAGDKFRPVIVFRPNNTDTVAYPRSMISVAGGSLALRGVAVELDMPRTLLSENWAMIETQRADSIELDRCLLTVRNASDQRGAYHLDVSIFDVKAAPGSSAMLLAMGMAPLEPVKIQLYNSVARGEAVFLRANDLQPLSLTWNNGLLATSERFLVAGGGATAPPQGAGQMRIELRHVTAVVEKGLCRLAGSHSAPWLLDSEIQCVDSIIVAGDKEAALIDQLGAEGVNQLQRRVAWRGDHNVYQGFDNYWKVTDLTSSAAPLLFSYEQWTAHWTSNEIQPIGGTLHWTRPLQRELPAHRRQPAEFVLDPGQGATIVSGASDGGPRGLIVDSLPTGSDRDAAPDR